MISWKRGAGIGQAIILTAFLVFLLIPMFTVLLEKIYIKYAVNIMNENADLAVMSSVGSLDAVMLASGDIGFKSSSCLEEKIEDALFLNERDDITIIDSDISIHEKGETCPLGSTSDYDFVHMLIKVSMKRIYGNDTIEFYIHRDVEIPYTRNR